MRDINKLAIENHARAEYPRECCGLLVNREGKEHYIPCKNIAKTKNENFIIDPEDYANAEDTGDIVAIIHSHTDTDATASEADMVACESSGLPWYIVAYPKLSWNRIEPTGYKQPLLGRPFVHGVFDCYSAVRDWYKEEMNISIPDFPRLDGWWERGENLYLDNFAKAGFEVTDKLEYGCGILMKIQSDVVNHAAVYLGNDVIFHHLYNRLSCREVYLDGYYKKHSHCILKYVKRD